MLFHHFLRGEIVTAALALKSMLDIAAFSVASFTCVQVKVRGSVGVRVWVSWVSDVVM